jgi:hypothetical protein
MHFLKQHFPGQTVQMLPVDCKQVSSKGAQPNRGRMCGIEIARSETDS